MDLSVSPRQWESGNNPFLQAALQAAEKGWHVFPLKPNSKVPIHSGGFKIATTDEAIIRKWWTERPSANIGLATGEVSGITVIDVDKKNGARGEESANELGLSSDTLVVKTPSGGWHYYFRYIEGDSSRQGWLSGIDTRGDGGYVVAPGSEIDGATYEVVMENEIAPMPAEVRARLPAANSRPSNGAMPDVPAHAIDDDEVKQLRERLVCIDASDYELWTKMGMALYSHGGGSWQMLKLWDWWSQTCPEKYDSGQMAAKWRSFASNSAGKINIETLYRYSRQGGYRDPPVALTIVPDAPGMVVPVVPRAKIARNRLLPFSAIAQMPRPKALIDGILFRDIEHLLFGPQGISKTFVLISWFMSIAYGLDWCGRKAKQGKVIIVCGEGGGRLFADRLEAWLIHHGITDRGPLEENLRITEFPIAMLDNASVDELIGNAEAWGGVDMIAIDTMLANFGEGDENKQSDMARFMNQARRLRHANGAGIVLVHHTGHTHQDRPQGANAMRRNIDIELRVDRDATDPELFALRGGGTLKNKHGRGIGTIPYRLIEVELPYRTEDGEPITSAVIDAEPGLVLAEGFRAQWEAAAQAPAYGKNQRLALKVLGQLTANQEPDEDGNFHINSANFAMLCADEGLTRNRLGEVRRSLLEKGLITESVGGFKWRPA